MDYLNDLLKVITGLGPEAKTGAVMIALGYVCRILPKFPNKLIPYVCILGAPFLYPVLTNAGRVSPEVKNPIVLMVTNGFLIGTVAWALHDKLLARIEDHIPILKGLLARGDDKPEQEEARVDKATQP